MNAPTKYAVLIDAGSSGTRVHVYQWEYNIYMPERTIVKYVNGWDGNGSEGKAIQTLAPFLPNLRPSTKAIHLSEQLKAEPTTAEIIDATAKGVAGLLGPLLDHARKHLPTEKIKRTSLYVMATGGMRRHKLEHYEEYMILRDAITEYINKSGFREPFYDTISGEDEALYGWVAANYHSCLLSPYEIPHGFMEMGGESSQFAVALRHPVTAQDDRPEYGGDFGDYDGPVRYIKIWNTEYFVFVKTWMGLGAESAWKRHEARLRESDSVIPFDPCLPKGYAYRLSGSDKIVQGTCDFVGCMREALSLMDCPNKHCMGGSLCIYPSTPGAPGNGNNPPVGCLLRDSETNNPMINYNRKHFKGAAVYYRSAHGSFAVRGQEESFEQFWKNLVKFSQMDWETLKAKNEGEKGNEYRYVKQGFFIAAMAMTTLFLGFGVEMPLVAQEVVLQFAIERADRAESAAQRAENGAKKKHERLEKKLKHASEKVEEAEKKLSDANNAAAGGDQQDLEQSKQDLERCKRFYQARPSEANRKDYIDAMNATMTPEHKKAKCMEDLRKARDAWTIATNDVVEAYSTYGKAGSQKRKAAGVRQNLRKRELALLLELEAGLEGERLAKLKAKRLEEEEEATSALSMANKYNKLGAEALAKSKKDFLEKWKQEGLDEAEKNRVAKLQAETLAEQQAIYLAGKKATRLQELKDKRLAELETEKLAELRAADPHVGELTDRVVTGLKTKMEAEFSEKPGTEPRAGYSSIKEADWTLGRIILHVNRCKPEIRTKRGWVTEQEPVNVE